MAVSPLVGIAASASLIDLYSTPFNSIAAWTSGVGVGVGFGVGVTGVVGVGVGVGVTTPPVVLLGVSVGIIPDILSHDVTPTKAPPANKIANVFETIFFFIFFLSPSFFYKTPDVSALLEW